jgi:membrane protease YdiL (CAAX protease family)
LVLGVWLGLQTLLGLVHSAFRSNALNLLVLGAAEALVLGGATFGLALQRGPSRRRVNVDFSLLGVGSSPLHVVAIAVLLGIFVHPMASAVRELVERLYPTSSTEIEQKLALLRHEGPLDVVTLFLVIGGIGPLVEELFYRGVLFTRVRYSRGSLTASWLCTLGFVFTHGDVRDWPSLALVSTLLTWLRARTDSIWASVAAHAGFNCSTLTLMLFEPAFEASPVTVLVCALVVAGLLAFVTRTTRRLR